MSEPLKCDQCGSEAHGNVSVTRIRRPSGTVTLCSDHYTPEVKEAVDGIANLPPFDEGEALEAAEKRIAELEVARAQDQQYMFHLEGVAEKLKEAEQRLAEERKQWTTWGVIEIAVRNPNVASFVEHWEGRAEAAEKRIAELERELQVERHVSATLAEKEVSQAIRLQEAEQQLEECREALKNWESRERYEAMGRVAATIAETIRRAPPADTEPGKTQPAPPQPEGRFCMYCGSSEHKSSEHKRIPGPAAVPRFFNCCGVQIQQSVGGAIAYGKHKADCPAQPTASVGMPQDEEERGWYEEISSILDAAGMPKDEPDHMGSRVLIPIEERVRRLASASQTARDAWISDVKSMLAALASISGEPSK